MAETNPNARLEMFCDGVFAIAITLLILEIKIPPLESMHTVADLWHAIVHLWPSFFALCLSFTVLLISWVGHHNLLKIIDKTSSPFQFANGFFLFTVIFFPFPTAFMAEYLNTPLAQPAIVVFCLSCILHNIGWNVLERAVLKPRVLLKDTIPVSVIKIISRGSQMGFLIYTGTLIMALWLPYVALVISVLVWIYWLIISINLKQE